MIWYPQRHNGYPYDETDSYTRLLFNLELAIFLVLTYPLGSIQRETI